MGIIASRIQKARLRDTREHIITLKIDMINNKQIINKKLLHYTTLFKDAKSTTQKNHYAKLVNRFIKSRDAVQTLHNKLEELEVGLDTTETNVKILETLRVCLHHVKICNKKMIDADVDKVLEEYSYQIQEQNDLNNNMMDGLAAGVGDLDESYMDQEDELNKLIYFDTTEDESESRGDTIGLIAPAKPSKQISNSENDHLNDTEHNSILLA